MSNNKNIMVYVGGSKRSFHCKVCGCNVFQHPVMPTWEEEMRTYECNSCGARYTGETQQRSDNGN